MLPVSPTRQRGLFISFLVGIGACGSPEPQADPARAFVTYNVGLARGYISYAEERRPHVIEVINALEADVVCLEEVWTQADLDAIVAEVQAVFPHHHNVFLSDKKIGPASCTESETAPLRACIDASCVGIAASEIADCVLAMCAPEFGQLSLDCTDCAVANLGKEVDEIFSFCTTGSSKYTYEGSNGLLLLSRSPLTNTTHATLDPSTNTQRSVLGATVTFPELGDVAVTCTHLSADLTTSGLEYNGPAGSWDAENRVQGGAVLAHSMANAGDAELVVILGDLNSGPELPGTAVAELPMAAYEVLTTAGYLPHGPDLCTYCGDNLLVLDDAPNIWIDHIFTKGLDPALTARVTRIGTSPVSITPATGAPLETHPSDHYGVRLELTPAAK